MCRGESVRTAFMLAQGGEFAFVLLSLAAELKVLPEELNKLLIIVVVISMALTPGLASVGKYLADRTPEDDSETGDTASYEEHTVVPLCSACHLCKRFCWVLYVVGCLSRGQSRCQKSQLVDHVAHSAVLRSAHNQQSNVMQRSAHNQQSNVMQPACNETEQKACYQLSAIPGSCKGGSQLRVHDHH